MEFPGGKIEHQETPEDAIIREIEEELSLEILPISQIHTYEYTYPLADISLNLIQFINLENGEQKYQTSF